MSADEVIGRSPSGLRSCGKQIRHSVVIVLVVLLSHQKAGPLKD
jgi:hypothetical protein